MASGKVRVSDERLANRITHQSESGWKHAGIDIDIALDLRDCRARVAELEAQVTREAELRHNLAANMVDGWEYEKLSDERDALGQKVDALRERCERLEAAAGDVMGAFPEIAGSLGGLSLAAALAEPSAARSYSDEHGGLAVPEPAPPEAPDTMRLAERVALAVWAEVDCRAAHGGATTLVQEVIHSIVKREHALWLAEAPHDEQEVKPWPRMSGERMSDEQLAELAALSDSSADAGKLSDAERAVIEAAVALVSGWKADGYDTAHQETDLLEAVGVMRSGR
jgi:hypothetical protein